MEKTKVCSKEVFIMRRRYLLAPAFVGGSNVILYGVGISRGAFTPRL
jgi:hypothetical protein